MRTAASPMRSSRRAPRGSPGTSPTSTSRSAIRSRCCCPTRSAGSRPRSRSPGRAPSACRSATSQPSRRSPIGWGVPAGGRSGPTPRAPAPPAHRPALVAKLRAKALGLRIAILTDRSGETGDLPDALRYAALMAKPARSPPRDPADIHATAYIVYTSGTTGRPKGVLLTVHGMLWICATCWGPILGLTPRDCVLSPLPLFHSYALNLSVLGILATGASEYILEKYSTADCLRLLKSEPVTFFPGVPTMFHYLLEAIGKEGPVKFPFLRLCVSAGAIMPATLNREFESKLNVP